MGMTFSAVSGRIGISRHRYQGVRQMNPNSSINGTVSSDAERSDSPSTRLSEKPTPIQSAA